MLMLATTSKAQVDFNTFDTDHGYIKLGPGNSTWAHIYTDRPQFIFNKSVFAMGAFSSYYNYDLKLQTAGTDRLTIDYNSGKVGIGESNPQEKLHVNGSILLPVNKYLKFGTENASSGYLKVHNASCCYNTYFDIKGSLFFRNENGGSNQGALLGLQSDGTITMGVKEKYDNTVTNTDGHKLMVNGGILCENLKVIGDVPNSDHVFAADYKLKTIEEVQDFVETNKHLPEIPSARDFQKNGYSVGEMDDLLLRKVEELTLYVIQLKKENDKMAEKLTAVEGAIK